MRKKKFVILLATGAVAIGSLLVMPSTGQAVTMLEEKPLAGITLYMDQFCNNVIANALEDANAAKKAEEAQETEDTASEGEAQTKLSQNTASDTEPEKKEASAKEIEEQKKKEERIKLNLKYDKLGIADVHSYLNVRKSGSESAKIVGKMVKNTGCNVSSVKNGWAKIQSGNVKGYVKADYLITGEAAEKRALKVATLKAVVDTETLNVRFLPSTDSRIYDQLSEDEDYTIEKEHLTKEYMKTFIAKHCSKKDIAEVDLEKMYDDLGNWVMLSIDNEKMFVSKDFISMMYKLNRAVTIKEEHHTSSSGSSSSGTSSTGSSMVSYAMQFLGNRYVWGGTSLTNGTDCSGFTMRIYEHFGYSIPRTSAAQAAATRSVSSSDVRVGDLFFYGSGSVSHVALYIGNGQIIHASNARDGIKISSAYYRRPLKIGRVM